ncbi:MAG TPA: cupin domain-containing protein [Terriglobia bacterium]|nr:cupin domain-containing protein [Terriglobia bacterium]
MDVKAWEKQLRDEGFTTTYVWQDGPGAFYPDHTHSTLTAHVILEGSMILTCQGVTHTYQSGDRADVPAETIHSARMGLAGCRYLIGEK